MRRLRSSSIKSRGAAFLALLVCLFGLPAQAQPWDGSGTEGDPYQIWDVCDMQAIGANSVYWDAHFKLMADVDLSAYDGNDGNPSYNIIGTIEKPFWGVFDGNSNLIGGLEYSGDETENAGLFGVVSKYRDFAGGLNRPKSLAVDSSNGKIYWVDEDRIRRANLDGTELEDVIRDEVQEFTVDCQNQKIYWISRWKIKRADMDGGGIENLIEFTGVETGVDIAIDASMGKMYWSMENRIERSNLDGTGTEEIINENEGLTEVGQIAIDSNEGKIYWVHGRNGEIQLANLDGTGIEDLLITGTSSFSISALVLDANEGKIYWGESSNGKIIRANLDGNDVTDFIEYLEGPYGIALDLPEGKMYFSELDGYIRRINVDGTEPEIVDIDVGLAGPRAIALDITGRKIYFLDRGKIQRGNFDGTGVEELISTGYAFGISLDLNTGHIFFVDNYTIKRANLDGSSVTTVKSGLDFPIGLVVDDAGGKMYWTEWSLGDIMTANLNGSDTTAVVTSAYSPSSIALDAINGKVYWTETSTIRRANLDGTNIETVYTETYGSPDDIALDLQNGKMYWAALSAHKIKRANLDGSEVENVVTLDLYLPHNIALDVSAGLLYWSNEYHLYRTYIHGEGGEIQNLGVVESNINAGGCSFAGALVGQLIHGRVVGCYSTGFVDGEHAVGGLVGWNHFGEVVNSYSITNVSGNTEVGGLVGQNAGPIRHCYSLGEVTGNVNIGGVAGYNAGPRDGYDRCFWNSETNPGISGIGSTEDPGDVVGAVVSTLRNAETYIGWGCQPVWTIDDGNDTPRLIWENRPGELITNPNYGGGSGTSGDPYLICSAEQLNRIGLIRCDWDKHFKLMADIDLSGLGGDNFNIIGICDYYGRTGEFGYPFSGVFDGNGKMVSYLKHISSGEDKVGLFGYVYGSDAMIKNLGLVDPNIKSGTGLCIGPLIGHFHSGSCNNCYVQGGRVEGYELVGGLVGSHEGSSLSYCSSSSSVSGIKYVGGLVGWNRFNMISDCFAQGYAFGDTYVGGLSGRSILSTIQNCYSSGQVEGTGSYAGGLVGDVSVGTVGHSFWDVNTSGQASSAGGTGKTTVEMQTESTFTDAGWDFVGEVINGPNDIWDICEGTNYPKFVWQIPAADFVCPDGVNFIDYAFFAEHWLQSIYGGCGGVELTGDGKVNWVDFTVFAEYWRLTGCGECGGADFTGDENVDLADLYVFATYWLGFEYAEVDLTNDDQVGLDDLREFTENWLAGM